MKKVITIISCDKCGKEIKSDNDSVYFFIEEFMPGWASLKYDLERKGFRGCDKTVCKECFDLFFKKCEQLED